MSHLPWFIFLMCYKETKEQEQLWRRARSTTPKLKYKHKNIIYSMILQCKKTKLSLQILKKGCFQAIHYNNNDYTGVYSVSAVAYPVVVVPGIERKGPVGKVDMTVTSQQEPSQAASGLPHITCCCKSPTS